MLSGKGADTAKVHNACISHKMERMHFSQYWSSIPQKWDFNRDICLCCVLYWHQTICFTLLSTHLFVSLSKISLYKYIVFWKYFGLWFPITFVNGAGYNSIWIIVTCPASSPWHHNPKIRKFIYCFLLTWVRAAKPIGARTNPSKTSLCALVHASAPPPTFAVNSSNWSTDNFGLLRIFCLHRQPVLE